MSLAPAAAQADRELERKHPESAAKESPVQDTSLHPLGGVFSALGADGSDEGNSRLVFNALLQRRANGEMRALIMRRVQQGAGNHKTLQLVTQLHRSPVIQRECSCGGTCAACQEKGVADEEASVLQRQVSSAGDQGGIADAGVIPADSAGEPLDRQTREFMEPHFRSDFSDVRVHTDPRAAQSADALAADAYTTGRDIYFAAGKYAPSSPEGQHLIAHELTHTVQQHNGETPVAASRAGGVLVGDVADPLEAEAEDAADVIVAEGQEAPPVLSKDATPKVRRDFSSGAAAIWDATGGKVAKAVGWVWDEAKETAAALIDRVAPGVLPLLRNAGTFLYGKITGAMDGMFSGIASRVQKQGVVGAITGILGEIAGSIGKSLGQLAAGSCHSIVEAASSIIQFVKSIAGDAFAQLGKMAKDVGDFFSELWQDYGAPALDAIKRVAGEAWGWIKEQAEWLWDKLLPIRNVFSRAWNWVKQEFNIAKEGTVGFLDWLYDKAKEQWMKVRDKIAPILGPLKIVAGALLLLSPLGPIILIWKGAPYLWQALQWIWANGIKPAGEKLRQEFREHILPYILEGIDTITARLDEASAFLCGHAGTISSGLHNLEDALNGVPFLRLAGRMVGIVAGFFDNLAAKGKCKFSDVVGEVKSLLHKIHDFLKPVLEVLRQAALVAAFGPWAILDDGVWKTLNQFVAFAKKTPCIREIAGLLQVDAVMDKVGGIRATLKDIFTVLSDQKRFEAEIHKALDGLLAQIPGKAEAILGAFQGLDARHLDILLKRFLAPKIAETISKAPKILIDVVWSLVWPWPGVIQQYGELENQVEKLKASLWDFEFSKAMDAGLVIWRTVNGIIGLLYGWFFLASVLIGAVFGAPQAGAAVAYEVGEALLASTLIAEGLSIDKAKLNLMSPSRLAKAENEREEQDKEDYETISGGMMNLAMMAALAVLGEIAVDFAKAVFAEIKGIFLPEGAEPIKVDIPTKSGERGQLGEPIKKTEGVPEDATPSADDAAHEIPPEELKAEATELKQKAANPDNVRRPADPKFDAEIDADGHTFDREEADRSWCRHSGTVCDLNLGDDLNAKVDEALEGKPAEPEEPTPRPDKPSFKHGESDGGPGQWGDPTTPRTSKTAQRGSAYQQKVTGAPPGTEYKVPLKARKSGYVDFDGYDPPRNTLLDAKDFTDWPPPSPPKPAGLRDIAIRDILKEARAQVAAAKGTPIEWHAPTPEKVVELADILADGGVSGIDVVETPR